MMVRLGCMRKGSQSFIGAGAKGPQSDRVYDHFYLLFDIGNEKSTADAKGPSNRLRRYSQPREIRYQRDTALAVLSLVMIKGSMEKFSGGSYS